MPPPAARNAPLGGGRICLVEQTPQRSTLAKRARLESMAAAQASLPGLNALTARWGGVGLSPDLHHPTTTHQARVQRVVLDVTPPLQDFTSHSALRAHLVASMTKVSW